MANEGKKCFIVRNMAPIAAVVLLYLGVFYILGFSYIRHDIHVVRDEVKNVLVIEVGEK